MSEAYGDHSNLTDLVASVRRRVTEFLGGYLTEKAEEFSLVSPWGPDMCMRLSEFFSRGKMIRGALVAVGARSGTALGDDEVTTVAAAMEVFQAALLIHDDIMDKDAERRGLPSFHRQYEGRARADGALDAAHLGRSMAICAGDVAFFLAFGLLTRVRPDRAMQLQTMFTRELSLVGIAQTQDVRYAAEAVAPDPDDIARMYLFKTGRYTFSLPLSAGAALAGAGEEATRALSAVGENLGVVFQIKDDEIGLFGDPVRTGKPAGSDIREGKKTLYSVGLLRRADEVQRAKLAGIIGKPDLDPEDLDYVRRLIETLEVRSDVERRVETLVARTRKQIDGMTSTVPSTVPMLRQLLEYSLTRTT